jgi:hypothetical protein
MEGTQRAFLINKGIVIPKDIIVEEVFCYKKIALFNALIPFGELIILLLLKRSSVAQKTISYLNKKKVPIIWHLSIQSIVRIQII